MKDESPRRSELAAIVHPVVEEVEFAERLATTVTPDVEPPFRPAGREFCRHDQAVWLDRAIDLRHISPDDQAGLLCPRRLFLAKGLGSLHSEFELFACEWDFFFRV